MNKQIIDNALSGCIFDFAPGCTTVYDAIDKRDVSNLNLLLRHNFDVERLTHFLLRLVMTSSPRTVECARILLDHGADPSRTIHANRGIRTHISFTRRNTILLTISALVQDEEVTMLLLDSIKNKETMEYIKRCWGCDLANIVLSRGHYTLLERFIVLKFEIDRIPVHYAIPTYEKFLREGVVMNVCVPTISHLVSLYAEKIHYGKEFAFTGDILFAMLDLLLTAGKEAEERTWCIPEVDLFIRTHHQRVSLFDLIRLRNYTR